jgi:hypothetical protein
VIARLGRIQPGRVAARKPLSILRNADRAGPPARPRIGIRRPGGNTCVILPVLKV